METNAWRCLGSSVIGTSHQGSGRPCQDAHRWAVLPNGVLVAAVADGAGSAARAEEGSRRAVDASLDFLSRSLAEEDPATEESSLTLAQACVSHAEYELRQLGGSFEDFATTLIVLFAGNHFLAMAQVGDGSAVCSLAPDDLQVLTRPEHGEYINETTFLTSPGYAKKMHLSAIPSASVNAVAMMTDGVQCLAIKFADNSAHPPFFRSIFDFAGQPSSEESELSDFLSSPRVCEKTDDDKTLFIAVRHDVIRSES
jgi:hypothetical protein